VPDRVAKIITETLGIPVIGIGAGINCDGQALVTQDVVGLFEQFVPKFVKQYLNLWEEITGAVKDFKVEVETLKFPRPEHSFSISEEQFLALMSIYEQKSKADEPEGRS
jgi:3-methyl-2-oxobutanoate hydroxymethyltransferase